MDQIIPLHIKKSACLKYGISENPARDRIINDLSKLDFKICHQSFIEFRTNSAHGENKNPKPQMIQDIFQKFGINDVFKMLNSSIFEKFLDESQSIRTDYKKRVVKILCKYIKKSVSNFPYYFSKKRYNNFLKLDKTKYKGHTPWHVFLNAINRDRHSIVHGNNFENSSSYQDLERKVLSVKLVQLVLILIMCNHIN